MRRRIAFDDVVALLYIIALAHADVLTLGDQVLDGLQLLVLRLHDHATLVLVVLAEFDEAIELLKKSSIPATFFVPAVSALLYPDEQRRVIAEGHEIGLHGWIHEVNSVLPAKDERELHLRAAET